MWGIPGIFGCATAITNLPKTATTTSMGSNRFGVSPNGLAKFNGVSVNFGLHLEESAWRWKRQPDELAKELWQLVRNFNLY
jgi:hypothetical protein